MAKIPDFETLQEAAEFWDTHNSTEYFDDMEELEIEVALRRNIFYPKSVILAERPTDCLFCKDALKRKKIQYAKAPPLVSRYPLNHVTALMVSSAAHSTSLTHPLAPSDSLSYPLAPSPPRLLHAARRQATNELA